MALGGLFGGGEVGIALIYSCRGMLAEPHEHALRSDAAKQDLPQLMAVPLPEYASSPLIKGEERYDGFWGYPSELILELWHLRVNMQNKSLPSLPFF